MVNGGVENGSVVGLSDIGGVIGYLLEHGDFYSLYSASSVTVESTNMEKGGAGGFIGHSYFSKTLTSSIANVYSSAKVSGYSSVGGLLGVIEFFAKCNQIYLSNIYTNSRIINKTPELKFVANVIGEEIVPAKRRKITQSAVWIFGSKMFTLISLLILRFQMWWVERLIWSDFLMALIPMTYNKK